MLTLRRQHTPPLRYEVCLDHQTLFTVSRTTLKQFISSETLTELKIVPAGHEIPLTLPIEEMEACERKELLQAAYYYLAKKEASPYHLRLWLRKRGVPDSWQDQIVELCIDKGFLSAQRFAEGFVRRRYRQGKKPWGKVRFELTQHEVPEEIIEELVYADIDMLRAKYTDARKAEEAANFGKLKAMLERQGFSYGTIKDLEATLNELNELSENEAEQGA